MYAPVSYTHLDVYKRQVLSSSGQMCWEVFFLVKHFIDIADMMKTVMSNVKVAFTGHRSIPFATINVLRQRISDCVENLYLSGKTEYPVSYTHLAFTILANIHTAATTIITSMV